MKSLLQAFLLVVLGVGIAIPVAASTFLNGEREVVIGAHDAVVSPTVSGYAVLDFGPLLPRLRLPADAPADLGVTIRLGEADVSSLEQLVARDAIIASQPEGEIAAVRSAVVSLAVDAILRGIGFGVLAMLLTVLSWRAAGPARRREIAAALRRPSRRVQLGAVATALVTVAALALVGAPDRPRPVPTVWQPIRTVFPALPDDEVLRTLEVSDGASTAGSRAIVEGALSTYRESLAFYGQLAISAATVDVRSAGDGETTALVVTDRHDNISMDPVARAIADRAGARLLIDLGDDTSTGASWESFSINSLAREFEGFDVVAVAGNHDSGTSVVDQMKDKGFTVLDGTPTTVAGIRFIGGSDPRSSGLTAGYNGNEPDNISAIRLQDQALTKAACADGRTTVAAIHSAASGRDLSRSGCVDLVLSGHLHRQVGPTEVVAGKADSSDTAASDGRVTTTLSTGSTGGAVYAFALGSKLRRQAQVTIVTFAEGRPIGLQPVSFNPGGIIEVAEYTPLTLSPDQR
ncbi:MAG: metallophosphoesterase [Aeromicrobium sp.]